MNGKKIIYYLLAAFITGNLILIFIQHNSVKNIHNLVEGNRRLLNEFRLNSTLSELEREIILVESKIRGAVATDDIRYTEGLDSQLTIIHRDLSKLQAISIDNDSIQYITELDSLTQAKLAFSRQVLNEFKTNGKTAAEKVIATNRGRYLSRSIIQVTQQISLMRQKLLAEATSSVDDSGEKARSFGTILIIAVLVTGAAVFWFVINTIRNQGILIEQLNISDKKAREAARVKENFLANMSHEIRTPMNAILGFTTLLNKRNLDKESHEYVHIIQRSGENLLTIINDILDLSKIESGMMRIESAAFSIRGLAHSVEAMFKQKVEEKGLLLYVHVEDTVPDILEGDSVRLSQILVNLVGNSLKFTNKGQIYLQISDDGISDEAIQTGITVSDTGIGMNRETLNNIFERFHQAEDSTTRKFGGTGLGLAIVKDLVELQNGNLDVHSEPGKGTSFHLMIPYKISRGQSDTGPVIYGSSEQGNELENICVLIVEDNEINQTLLKHLLANRKIKFEIVNNGREAVRKLQTSRFDLILMDIQMPEMDGYTATGEIRNALRLQTPIIAMTARALAGEKERCLGYGMNEYISKPIREEQLHRLIVQFTRKEQGQSAVRPARPRAANPFQYINLQYMKEISNGNKEYEKAVTEQFLESMPAELEKMEVSWKQGSTAEVQQTAHNLKTTVSVMGLNQLLQPHLDALEYETLSGQAFYEQFDALQAISKAAITEAKMFYAEL